VLKTYFIVMFCHQINFNKFKQFNLVYKINKIYTVLIYTQYLTTNIKKKNVTLLCKILTINYFIVMFCHKINFNKIKKFNLVYKINKIYTVLIYTQYLTTNIKKKNVTLLCKMQTEKVETEITSVTCNIFNLATPT